jgi:predicted enzyme related to lactoylglutathione lyase
MDFNLNFEGEFNWHELHTTDIEGAKKFYSAVFSWEFNSYETDEGELYTLISLEDDIDSFANVRKIDEGKAHWGNYILVEDIDDVLEDVEENGGKIVVAKTLIFDIGNFAVIQDPQGAVISIMETLEDDWEDED